MTAFSILQLTAMRQHPLNLTFLGDYEHPFFISKSGYFGKNRVRSLPADPIWGIHRQQNLKKFREALMVRLFS
jgi:hypothetical protein